MLLFHPRDWPSPLKYFVMESLKNGDLHHKAAEDQIWSGLLLI